MSDVTSQACGRMALSRSDHGLPDGHEETLALEPSLILPPPIDLVETPHSELGWEGGRFPRI